MMEKGFLQPRRYGTGIWITLLACVAGLCGPLSAAEIRGVRIASTETGTRLVLDLAAPAAHKAFMLDGPDRVGRDVARSSLKPKVALPPVEGPITGMRTGKLPNHGVRLVFEVKGPVTIDTSSATPAGEAGHRLILDIATPAAKAVAATPAAPV